jgi:hypothetical protein
MDKPALNFEDLTHQADQYYDVSYSWLVNKGVPGWLAVAVSGFTAGTNMVLPVLLAVFVQGLLGVGQFFAVTVLSVIGQARETNQDDFNQVIASATNELLGTKIDAGDLSGGNGSSPGIANQGDLGDAVLQQFEDAFGMDDDITPERGAENARKFAGFAVNYATSQAFLSILTEAASVGVLKEFHELPDALQQALGLGRLSRLALQPLIRNCIQQPYDLLLKYKLRPDRLSEAQIVRALHAGQLDEGDARQALAEKGYRDNDIDLLIKDLALKITVSELIHLIRYQEISEDAAIEKLTAAGMSQEDARLQLKAAGQARGDSQVGSFLSWLESSRVDGFIDQGSFDSMLQDLPLADEEERLFRKRVAAKLEYPRKRTTFAQVKGAIVRGHVDFTYLDTWLQDQGYSDYDQLVLEAEVIDAMEAAEAKAAAKAKTAAKLAAKGISAPATLKP